MLVCDYETVQLPRSRMTIPSYMRTASSLVVTLERTGERTGPARLRESGALRLRFPRVGGGCEGIIVNTSGGIAGGDRQQIEIAAGAGAEAALTTQSAEKVYRSDGEIAAIATRMSVAVDARLAWLPQESILFDGARLSRRIDVDMATSATFTMKEAVVLGRTARQERVRDGRLHDRWRIRRDGRLLLAEAVRLDGDMAGILDRAATGNGACALATIVHVSPSAATRVDDVRSLLTDAPCDAGASAWNGMLVVRLAGAVPHEVRRLAAQILSQLLPGVSPRIWSC